ncbi:HPF/RaiA family ribosome-associated protein [Burkholderia ubonensis]|uniref:HPF/RaiA family ribosome-associated protein n=1 Tax=Burkholderia ubonensis TaxID=101571 RepID=UPI001453DE62|nr:HPF/RaiA family ribosome-associated protein [Burkholderia ubonensis]VWB07936.1 hypothetical protein BUB20358_00187 [Burkholderia ubonensis]
MKTAISFRNISELARPDLKGLIGNLLDRHLQPHLSHFPAELVRLRATLERSGHRSLYRARLRLGLPSATLACSDESPELGKALELSFTELQRQLERHIAHLRHEDNCAARSAAPGCGDSKTRRPVPPAPGWRYSAISCAHCCRRSSASWNANSPTCRRVAISHRGTPPSMRSSTRRWPAPASELAGADVLLDEALQETFPARGPGQVSTGMRGGMSA